MRFAYTPHNNAIEPQVIEWVERMISAGDEVYALLDGSMLSSRDLNRLEHHGLDFQPALAGSLFESYGLQGPLIGTLDANEADALHTLLQRTDGLPCLSFIASRQAQTQLCERLIWLAKVDTEDGQSLHCRFADTRVLPSLLNLFKPEQHNALAEVLTEWAWVTRDASFRAKAVFVVDAQKRIMEDEPLRFDAQQFDTLLIEAEPDMVFQMLIEKMPDVVPDMQMHQIHVRLARLLNAARGRGLADLPDLFQYAVVGLVTCDDFDQSPVLTATWQRIKASQGRFGELAGQWSEETWQSLGTQTVNA